MISTTIALTRKRSLPEFFVVTHSGIVCRITSEEPRVGLFQRKRLVLHFDSDGDNGAWNFPLSMVIDEALLEICSFRNGTSTSQATLAVESSNPLASKYTIQNDAGKIGTIQILIPPIYKIQLRTDSNQAMVEIQVDAWLRPKIEGFSGTLNLGFRTAINPHDPAQIQLTAFSIALIAFHLWKDGMGAS